MFNTANTVCLLLTKVISNGCIRQLWNVSAWKCLLDKKYYTKMFFTYEYTVSVQITTFHSKNLTVVTVKKRMGRKFVNNLSEGIKSIITTIFNYLKLKLISSNISWKKETLTLLIQWTTNLWAKLKHLSRKNDWSDTLT